MMRWNLKVVTMDEKIEKIAESSQLTTQEAQDYWDVAWNKKRMSEKYNMSEQEASKYIQEIANKISGNVEIIHRVVASKIFEFTKGELTRSEDTEGIYELSQTPDDLPKFEHELNKWANTGEISLIVLCDKFADDGTCLKSHVRIIDVIEEEGGA